MSLRLPSPALATVHALPLPAEPSDAVLVQRVRSGDRSAEALIYTRHVGYVMNLCARLLGNRQEAEDAVQDTFVDVLEQLGSLREPERLRHWIARVAVHKAHRKFRRRRVLRALGLGNAAESDLNLLPARAGVSAEHALELKRLSAVLARLPDTQRLAWVLRYVDGYKLEEVAELSGCSLASTKRRLVAAEQVVRAHVQVEEAHDEA